MIKKILSTIAFVVTAYCYSLAQMNPADLRISGYVYNANGGPVSNWTVCVVSDSTNAPHFNYYQCVNTDTNGYYSFYIQGGSPTGPNIPFTVYTWDCQQALHDTIINNMQGTVDVATADFYICANNTNTCDASFSWGTVPGSVVYQFTANADPNSGYTYSWDFGDGTTGTGDQITHTYSQLGSYAVTLSAENCGLLSSFTDTVTFSSTGLSDLKQPSIYFYEATSHSLRFNNSLPGNAELFIYDLSGKQLIQQSLFKETTSVSLNNLNSGIYLVGVNTATTTFSGKLLIP